VSYDIIIKGINKQRRPASEMDQLYEETEASIESRRELADLRKLAAGTRAAPARRPSKHERQHIVRFKRKQ